MMNTAKDAKASVGHTPKALPTGAGLLPARETDFFLEPTVADSQASAFRRAIAPDTANVTNATVQTTVSTPNMSYILSLETEPSMRLYRPSPSASEASGKGDDPRERMSLTIDRHTRSAL